MNPEVRETINRNSQDAAIDFSPWVDRETGIEGWIAIFGSKSMPAAGGGLRIGAHLTRDDAIPIAKAMRSKFHMTGPGNLETGEPINGAGIIIRTDPKNITPDMLTRFLTENRLKEKHIGTAASTGVDTTGVCESLGIIHFQEPIAHGLSELNHTDIESTLKKLRLTTDQLSNPFSNRHQRPIDVATGFSAADITQDILGELQHKRFGIIGFGAVGASFTKRISELDGNIVFIANSEGAIVINREAQIDTLFRSITKQQFDPIARLHLGQLPDITIMNLAHTLQNNPVDILVLAGPEKSFTDELTKAILLNTTIIPLANKPFASDFGEQLTRDTCTVLPSTSNVGNAVLFSLALMDHKADTPEKLVSATIDLSRLISRSSALDDQQPVWKNFVKGESHE
jgi:glutamate dehydrogenase/leucine dehydrogenase